MPQAILAAYWKRRPYYLWMTVQIKSKSDSLALLFIPGVGNLDYVLAIFFSIKSQTINSLGSADSTVFAIAIPFCYCSLKDAIDNILMRKYGYNSIKLY